MKTRKIKLLALFTITAFLVLGGVGYNASAAEEQPALAEWVDSNGQRYLHVRSSDRYELGQLQGGGLVEQVAYLKGLIQAMGPQYGLSYEYLVSVAMAYGSFIPAEYIVEMQGIADGATAALVLAGIPATITLEDVLVQNAFLDIFYGQVVPLTASTSPEVGCTAFGVENEFWWFKTALVGQNFDFRQEFFPALGWVLTEHGGKAIFSIRMGAMLSIPTGTNGDLSVTVNTVESVAFGALDLPVTVRARMAFETAATPGEFVNVMTGAPSTMGYNLIVAGDKEILTAQVNPALTIVEDVEDLVIRSNTYVAPELQPALVDDDYSKARQAYAEERLQDAFDGWLVDWVTHAKLQAIITDNDVVCQVNPPLEKTAITLAFFTCRSFGLSCPADAPWGTVPI